MNSSDVYAAAHRFFRGGNELLFQACVAGIAVILAWKIPNLLLGHENPTFGTFIVITALAPGLSNTFRTSLSAVAGVVIGMSIGEAGIFLLAAIPLWLQVFVSVTLAMFIGALLRLCTATVMQAGISVVIIFAVGPEAGGLERMTDAAIAIAIVLLFSQILSTPDPVVRIKAAAHNMIGLVSSGLNTCVAALETADVGKAQTALQQLSGAHSGFSSLDTSLMTARDAVQWSVRGRMHSDEVIEVAARSDRDVMRIFAAALLFAIGVVRALRNAPNEMPPNLREDLSRVIGAINLIGTSPDLPDFGERPAVGNADWRRCQDSLEFLADAVAVYAGDA